MRYLFAICAWLAIGSQSFAGSFAPFQASGYVAPSGSTPIVTNATFSPSTPASSGGTVGTVSATNTPTSWSITAGNSAGDFAISNSGVITFTATGQTDWAGAVNQKTATLTVQATNASGNGSGIVDVNGYADGSVNAASGTIQHSSVLSGYSIRPPWKAPGFDYYVGIPTGTSLSPASGISNPNITLTSKLVECTGSGASVTLNAIDFTGFAIYVPSGGCVSITVKNSNFACTGGAIPNFTFIQNQNNATEDIENNKFDSYTNCNDTFPSNLSDIMQCGTGSASCTIKYNWFYHQSERAIDAGCGPLTETFNLFDNPNTISGAHENTTQQVCGSSGSQTGQFVSFNSLYNTLSNFGAEGHQFEGATAQQFTTASPEYSYNTLIALKSGGSNTMSNMIHGFCASGGNCNATAVTVIGTSNVRYNYFDPSGANSAFYPGASTAMWPSQVTFTGNINMNTGATLVPQ